MFIKIPRNGGDSKLFFCLTNSGKRVPAKMEVKAIRKNKVQKGKLVKKSAIELKAEMERAN